MRICQLKQISIKKIAIVFFPLFLYSFSFAKNLNEETATILALQNSRELKIAEQELEVAKGARYEAVSTALPQIYIGLSYSRINSASVISPFIPEESFLIPIGVPSETKSNKLSNNYGGQVLVLQPLFTWGQIKFTNVLAKQNYLFTKEKLSQAKNDCIFKAKENFYKTLLAIKLSLIADESYDLSQKRLEMTKNLFNEGKASKYDVSRAEVVVANARTLALKAENIFEVSKETLKSFLDLKEDIVIEGEFNFQDLDFSIDEIWEKMVYARPEIKQMGYRENIAKSLLSINKTNSKPKINCDYYYTSDAPDLYRDFNSWNKSWILGVSLYWHVFDGLLSYGKIKKADAQLEQVRNTNKANLEVFKLEAISAYLNFNQAKKSISVEKENVILANENLKIAHKRYSMGLMSSIELQDVQFAFSQAKTNYQQALYDYNIAIATILKVMGSNN
ncbi:MAG: TolC family protein [Elusimicrobia bacterium]|nr:TolC family protein [Elusimicrobiota bacterium]